MFITEEELLKIFSADVQGVGSSNKWAKLHGIPRRSVDMALNGERSITQSIGRVYGYEKVKGWVKKG